MATDAKAVLKDRALLAYASGSNYFESQEYGQNPEKIDGPISFTFTVQSAATIPKPQLIDFVLDGRAAYVWAARPGRCIHHEGSGSPVRCQGTRFEATGWEMRDMLDCSGYTILVFRRYMCTSCRKSVSNVNRLVLDALPRLQRLAFPAHLLGDHSDETAAGSALLEGRVRRQNGTYLFTRQFAVQAECALKQGINAEQFARLVNEQSHHRHSRNALAYYSFESIKAQGAGLGQPAKLFPAFASSAEETAALHIPVAYGGKDVTGDLIRSLWKALALVRKALDFQFLQNISGDQLSVDFTPELRAYEKQLVRQASCNEAARATLGFQGVESVTGATQEQPSTHPAVQLPLLQQQRRAGSGKGGEGGTKLCLACSRVFGMEVAKKGHSCIEALIYGGKDPRNFEHTQKLYREDIHGNMTKEDAQRILEGKRQAAEKEEVRRLKRKANK